MEQDASWLHNFSPVSAVALCGAVYFPRRVALVLPFGALLASDIILNTRAYHVPFFTWEIIPHYVALAMVAALGWMLRSNPRVPSVLGASALGSTIFYLVTNTSSWIGQQAYQKSFAGWLQALTIGRPDQHPTTLEFYRGTFISDLAFTALFMACMLIQRRAEAPAPRVQEPARWC
jgi:hypothetical protein